MSDDTPGHNDASDSDKIDGIVEQVRADLGQGHILDITEALRQRLSDAGMVVTDAEFDALLKRLL